MFIGEEKMSKEDLWRYLEEYEGDRGICFA